MEALFKDSVKLNKETFKRIILETKAISPKQRKKMLFSRILYLAATVAVAYQGWFCFTKRPDSIIYIVLGILSVVLGIFFLSRGLFYNMLVVRSAVKKSLRMQEESGAVGRTDEYKFYDEYFNAVTQRYRHGKKIYWKNVTRVYESESYFFVYAKDKNSFFLYKPTIKGGTVEEFRAFLESKIPCEIATQIL